MEQITENINIKNYGGLAISLGMLTFLHLLVDVIAFVPILNKTIVDPVMDALGMFALLIFGISILISITCYILSIIAATILPNLIRKKHLNGHIFLILILTNLTLLILTIFAKGSILRFFDAW